MLIFGIILGLISLVVLVVIHELGHAIAARRNGVVVEEFGIGFPPKAWGKKLKNGVLFTLNWLPLGGFVKLQGEHDAATKKGDYGAASFWVKTKILLAGVFINWLAAALLFTGLAFFGLPKIIDNQFTVPADTTIVTTPVQVITLEEGYPAAEAGFVEGDEIVMINSEPIETVGEFIEVTQADRGETVTIGYTRDGESLTTDVTLRDADASVFGAVLAQSEEIKATWSAPIVGVVTTAQFSWVTIEGLGQVVGDFFGGMVKTFSTNIETREEAQEQLDAASASVAGPVGILGVIFPAASEAGFDQFIFLVAIISLTLAVMNILPIPALDGGRWFVTAVYKLLRKPLKKETEEMIHGIGFMALMVLVVIITVADVGKLF